MKAKDLLEKTKSASDDVPRLSQSEKVNEAYENISKKLEELRGQRSEARDQEPDDDEIQSADKGEESEKSKMQEESGGSDGSNEPDEKEPGGYEKEELSKPERAAVDEMGSEDLIIGHTDRVDDDPLDREDVPKENTLDDLAKEESESIDMTERSQDEHNSSSDEDEHEEMHIPNLHSHKPTMNFGYRERQPNHVERRSSKWQLWVLLIIGLAVVGGTVLLLKNKSILKQSPTPAPTMTTSTISPTPIPTPRLLERSKFKIRVLNGTTKTGMAASVSASLKDLGYQIEKTGNATNSAFERTLIRLKASATGLFDQLIADLAPKFDATSSSPLKDTDSVDGEVILGTR